MNVGFWQFAGVGDVCSNVGCWSISGLVMLIADVTAEGAWAFFGIVDIGLKANIAPSGLWPAYTVRPVRPLGPNLAFWPI